MTDPTDGPDAPEPEFPEPPTQDQARSWETMARIVYGQPAPPAPPLTAPDLRRAVREALLAFLLEVVAPAVAIALDPALAPEQRAAGVARWLDGLRAEAPAT